MQVGETVPVGSAASSGAAAGGDGVGGAEGMGSIYDHKLGMGITGFVAETGECVMLPTCVCDAPDTHV